MIDAGLLEEVLWHIHNWFERDSIAASSCTIDDGQLPTSITSNLVEGQWYRVEGSILNDGLHLHPDTNLQDETFDGTITPLVIPKPLLRIVNEIQEWVELTQEARNKALASPYQSESFDGYSYSIRGDLTSNSASGGPTGLSGWQAVFATRLNPWRKIL